MNRPRLIRGLRISWSMWWGILCVLLIWLWVRSYWQTDAVYGLVRLRPVPRSFVAESAHARFAICIGPFRHSNKYSWPWGLNSDWGLCHSSVVTMFVKLPPAGPTPSFSTLDSSTGFHLITTPIW